MKIAIPKERAIAEARVAATPDTVKKYIALGCEVTIETGAGLQAAITDAAYEAAGATIAKDAKTALSSAELVLKVQRPLARGEARTDKTSIDALSLINKRATLMPIPTP